MNDKKSCENCDNRECPHRASMNNPVCADWKRNPHMWLSILPAEPGKHWYRLKTNHSDYGLMEIEQEDVERFTADKAYRKHISHFEWQGPITPEGV